MAVEITQLQREQIGDLCEFLRLAYPDDHRKHNPDFLNWYFLENPYVDKNNIPLWIAVDNGRIVGQLATILVQLKVGATYRDAIWILEFILLPAYRGQGLGKRLVLAAQAKYPTMITLGINEASTRVFDSLGWARLGGIHRFHRLLYPGNAMPALANMRFLREPLNWLYAPLRFSPEKKSRATSYELRHADSVDPALDELWAEASVQWPCAVLRSPKFLGWQFLQQPGKKFDFVFLYRRGKLAGYAALFFRKASPNGHPPKAALCDLVYSAENPDEVIDVLLEAALEAAFQRRAGSLVTDILDPMVEARLRRFRFTRIAKSPRFMACAPDQQDLLYHPEKWFLTRADSDVSIFEGPNVA